jgi:cytochrome c heme-lyase
MYKKNPMSIIVMSGCPHHHDRPSSEGDLNPVNAMPADLHKQLPSPGQTRVLSTDRELSTIPKKDGSKWEYPSPQMFFNAMKRKVIWVFFLLSPF